jgi:hypothetical protein
MLEIRRLEQALAQDPDNTVFLLHLSALYRAVGRLDEALVTGRRAAGLRLADAVALHNLAMVHRARGEVEDSLAWARRAVHLRPDLAGAHMSIAEAQLLLGGFDEGWEEYEWRYRMPGAPPPLPEALAAGRPLWDGGHLGTGQLMLVADQGFGDVIQFSRYVPWAVAHGQPTILAASDEMAPLMRRLFPGLPIATRREHYADFTAYCPLSSLPRLHGTRPDTIPPVVPLAPEAGGAAVWRGRLDGLIPAGLRRVGLVWAGRPTHPNDSRRSIRFPLLADALGRLPGVALVSLQKGERSADLALHEQGRPVIDIARNIRDYDDTAGVIAALDLVVTVDTSVAHLAGAMGRAAWVLLPFACDWRWMRERTDSPWYPSLRLFRQPAPEQWDAPLAAIVAELRAAPIQPKRKPDSALPRTRSE